MSSHHIVRDNQEPALIIANGEECSYSLLSQLLEWIPYVLVLDGAIHRVLERQIRMDAWLGDFDSSLNKEISHELEFAHVEVVHAPDQEKTDLQKGIEFLVQKGFSAVNIIWASGKRVDHALNNLLTLPQYSDQITITVLDDWSKSFILPKSFRKWYPRNTILSLIPIGKVESISTQNLLYSLSNENLEMPYRSGSSNQVVSDGWVEINYKSGWLLLIEVLEG